MEKLHFSIDINAPKQKVWEVMLADKTYREWTNIFNPNGGSYYEGSWDKGSKIVFLGPDKEGNLGGMVATIAENRPYEFISIKHIGEVRNGVEDTTSDRIKKWIPAYENYTLTEKNGVTTLEVDVDSDDEFKEMFEGAWPKALEKLKDIAENK